MESTPRNGLVHIIGARLVQPRQPAFWLWAGFVVLGVVFMLGQQGLLRQISPSGWTLAWFLALVYAAPLIVVIWTLDLYEREPPSLVVGALLWGAFAATSLSIIANVGWGLAVARAGGPEFATRWSSALTAPLIEETLKGLGVVVIWLVARDEFDDAMDGFVYGAACGLGFAVVEDVFYFMAVFGGNPAEVLAGFFLRVVAGGLYSHVLYTGLVGLGFGYAVSSRTSASRARRLGVLACLATVAVAAHFLWNSPLLDLFPAEPWTGGDLLIGVPIAAALKGLPLLGFVAAAVGLSRRHQRRRLRRALEPELGGPAISIEELETLVSARTRRLARRSMGRRAGPRAAGLLARLQREQLKLAEIASRSTARDDLGLVHQRGRCSSLRAALLAIPAAAPTGSKTAAG